MSSAKERQSNFELLRILAMLLIVATHLIAHGVIRVSDSVNCYSLYSNGSLENRVFSAFLEWGGKTGVALFFMLTGYFLWDKDKISLMKVVLQTMFYGISSVVMFALIVVCGFDYSGLGKLTVVYTLAKSILIPVSSGEWWFVTSYVLIIIIHPILNQLFNRLNRKGCLFIIAAYWLFEYSLSYALSAMFVQLQRGVLFYLIGSYLHQYVSFSQGKGTKYLSFLISVPMLAVYTVMRYYINTNALDETITKKGVVSLMDSFSVAVCIPILAICIFYYFGSISISYSKVINTIASTTFGVYLIHDSTFGRLVIWNDLVKIEELYLNKLFPLYSFICILAVFAICSIIDMLRIKAFEPIMLKYAQKAKDKFIKAFVDKSKIGG